MQRVDGEVGVSGLTDVRADLGRAIGAMFARGSSAAQRKALIDRLYAPVGFCLFLMYSLGSVLCLG